VDERVNWFDGVQTETWSTLWFEDFVEQLGYEMSPRFKFYWLLPQKTIADGLRLIESDRDTIVMANMVDWFKTLIVYLDQDGFEDNTWDDIVLNPVAELPKVLSPRKINYQNPKSGEKLPVFYADLDKGVVGWSGGQGTSESTYEDEDFIDSDNEVLEGDEESFEDLVYSVVDQKKSNKKARGSQPKGVEIVVAAVPDDEGTEEEELDLPGSDGEGEDRLRMKCWTEADVNQPSFSVGLVFPIVEKMREAITEYSVRNRVEIKMPRNDQRRLRAHCVAGCPWNLYASLDSRVKSFVVKTYYGGHNCHKEWVLKRCTSKWLATKYIDSFRANDKMSISSFGRTVQKDLNLTPSRSKLARARRLIMKAIHGDEVNQYNLLWDYGQELRRSNPGSTFYLNICEMRFSTCYMSQDACKRGFMASCRPIICLDGCHIKTKYGGAATNSCGHGSK